MARNRHFTSSQRFGQRPWAVAALGLTMVLIGGCTAETSATPTGVATSVPTATEGPTESPSPDATATESAAASIAPDADLAELLPTTLGGEPVSVARFDGEDLTEVPRPENRTGDQDPIGFGMGNGGVATLAEELDVLPAEVQGAMAYAPDHEPDFYPHAVVAVRVAGSDPAAMVDALSIAIGGHAFLAGQLTFTEQTIGEKDVSVLESRSADIVRNPTYLYVVGDVAFIVIIDDPDEAETVLQDLP